MADAAPRGETRLCVDGHEAAPGAAAALPADDRGLAYGDGVFRTIRFDDAGPWLWDAHLSTLARDARRIELPWTADDGLRLTREARAIAGGERGVLRVTLTRGSGPRGYAPPSPVRVRRVLSFTPGAPLRPPERVTVQLAKTMLPLSPALAGVKHLGRLEHVLAAAEPGHGSVFERLMQAPGGALVCGTRCNLFLRIGRQLLTPRVDRCGVAGVVRGQLLGQGARWFEQDVDVVEEAELDADAFAGADELLLTNAVQGVVAVDAMQDADGVMLARYPGRSGVLRRRLATHAEYTL